MYSDIDNQDLLIKLFKKEIIPKMSMKFYSLPKYLKC